MSTTRNLQHLAAQVSIFAAIFFYGFAQAWVSGPESKDTGPAEAQVEPPWGWPVGFLARPNNEHAQILDISMERAGLPQNLRQTPQSAHTVKVYARHINIPGTALESVFPQPFNSNAETLAGNHFKLRKYTISGFASLPDHAYSIADWAGGNETCPPGTTITSNETASKCHEFSSHLGLLNSTHFLPQAQSVYVYYHGMAMRRATECLVTANAFLASTFSPEQKIDADEIVKECEREALLLEAVGQHFLQDAWAIGHMWQRWGTPNFLDFESPNGGGNEERRIRALGAALTAGTIHGAEAVFSIPDEMSGGDSPTVRWRNVRLLPLDFPFLNSASSYPGIGDFHLPGLLGSTSFNYSAQSELMLSCGASGLRDVYEATARVSSEPKGSLGPFIGKRVDPTSYVCFGQRATNSAVATGLGLSCPTWYVNDPTTQPDDLLLCKTSDTIQFVAGLLPTSKGGSSIPASLADEFRGSLYLISWWSQMRALEDPNGVDLAESGLLPPDSPKFFGVPRNGAPLQISAVYLDSLDLTGDPEWDAAARLYRVFNKSHIAHWCANPETKLSTLRAQLAASTDGDYPASCELCSEFVSRNVKTASGPSLCGSLGISQEELTSPFPTNSPRKAAQALCGCASYDPARDFLRERNSVSATSTWQYAWGYMNDTSAFFELNERHEAFGVIQYQSPVVSYSATPAVAHNTTDHIVNYGVLPSGDVVTNIYWYPDEVMLHPSISGISSSVIWIPPVAGRYKISATFTGRDYSEHGTTTEFRVLRKRVLLRSGFINGGGNSATIQDIIIDLTKGDYIDFRVGPNGDYTSDSTGLKALITLLPALPPS